MASKKDQFIQNFADKVIQQLEAGTAPWQKPWNPGEVSAPFNPITGTVYKGSNFANLSMSGFSDPRWMTFNQAKKEGFKVRKGEKGTPIMYWKFDDRKPRLDDKGNKVKDADGKQVYDRVQLERPVAMVHTVFNASQIEGIEPYEVPEAHEWEAHARAEKVLTAANEDLRGVFYDQNDRAFYRPATDSVHLPAREQFATDALFYSTALHEIGHATGHSSRLDRDMGNGFGSQQYAREELRAEISAWMVAAEMGIGHDPGQHTAYVGSWIKALKENPAEIYAACQDAEKIKRYVTALEHGVEAARETLPNQVKGTTKPEEANPAVAAMPFPEKPMFDVYADSKLVLGRPAYSVRFAQHGEPCRSPDRDAQRHVLASNVPEDVIQACRHYHGRESIEALQNRYTLEAEKYAAKNPVTETQNDAAAQAAPDMEGRTSVVLGDVLAFIQNAKVGEAAEDPRITARLADQKPLETYQIEAFESFQNAGMYAIKSGSKTLDAGFFEQQADAQKAATYLSVAAAAVAAERDGVMTPAELEQYAYIDPRMAQMVKDNDLSALPGYFENGDDLEAARQQLSTITELYEQTPPHAVDVYLATEQKTGEQTVVMRPHGETVYPVEYSGSVENAREMHLLQSGVENVGHMAGLTGSKINDWTGHFEARPCEVINHNGESLVEECSPEEAHFWGVYAQESDGRTMHHADFKTEEEARSAVKDLENLREQVAGDSIEAATTEQARPEKSTSPQQASLL